MLVQFSVKNFRSFNDKATLSMFAGSDKEHASSLIDIGGKKRLLPIASIYGANASGKSNLIMAFHAMQEMITGRSAQLLKDKELPYNPFAFTAVEPKPTEFEIMFYYNGVRYAYEFSFDSKRIYTESLYHWPRGREALVFSRENNSFTFRENISEQTVLASRTPENKLYLVSSNEWNAPQTELAYKWFVEKLIPYDKQDTPDATIEAIRRQRNNPLREKIINELRLADLGIVDAGVSDDPNHPQTYVLMVHRTEENEASYRYPLPLEHESIGTQRFFCRIGPWIQTLEKGGVLFVDELDASLHPLLTRRLVEMMQNPMINTNQAQLIFTTHDAMLLDLSLVRRDQIWFTDKNPKTLTTELFSLSDFSARKGENIRKGYIQGRYGAVPFFAGDL